MNRGVERRDIFLDNRDRRTFVRLLAEVVPRYRWRLYAFVLMTNHFHLVIETIEETLSRGMQKLEGDYAEYFNWRRRRTGHLFQGRFKSHLVDSERYLLDVARYVVLNPVRAGLVSDPAEWSWSSYGATAGLTNTPAWLSARTLLDRFHPWDRSAAHLLYRGFVAGGVNAESPWADLVGQIYLGGPEFIARTQARINERARSPEHPREQRVIRCATIAEVRDAVAVTTGAVPGKSSGNRVRLLFAELARTEALASLSSIGEQLGIGATGASYLLRRATVLRQTDQAFASLLDSIRLQIRNCKLQM
jgi:REP element-mobilizing transposase RayT